MITESNLFVGRIKELKQMTGCMSLRNPMSINIYGEERIGKSSLLYQFSQLQNDHQCEVIFIDLQQASCNSEVGLYKEVARKLKESPHVQNKQTLAQLFPINPPLDRQGFEHAVRESKTQGVLIVLCLDEFEALFQYPEEFTRGFYSNLYSLMNRGALMLVVSSQRRLNVYKNQLNYAKFYQKFTSLNLSNLSNKEADELVQLPTKKGINSPPPVLDEEEQADARKLGGTHPYLLQLAAIIIYDRRQSSRAFAKAKTEFKKEARRIFWARVTNSQKWWGFLLVLRWLFVNLPIKVGSYATLIGLTLDDFKNWLIGMIVLILIGLSVFKVLTLPVLLEWLQKILNLAK
ncbi:MAG: ATP-binding protein [Nostoc sp.]